MKFVYVIVSSEKDYYTEEALVSMHSLKMYNPEAKITAVIDRKTFDSLKENRSRIKTYIDELIIPEIPDGLSGTQKSRYLKTSLRPLVKGDFLYLDNDTVINGDLSELEDINCDVAAVFNTHRNDWNIKNPHPMIHFYNKICKNDVLKEYPFSNYYNGGIILTSDTDRAHEYFKFWHSFWYQDFLKFGFNKDQISMWKANYVMNNIIEEIPAKFNCQLVYPEYALPYLGDAVILHYLSSTNHLTHLKLKQGVFLNIIKKNGITNEVEDCIINLKKEYQDGILLLYDEKFKQYFSKKGRVFRKVYHLLSYLNIPFDFLKRFGHRLYVKNKIIRDKVRQRMR